MKRFPRPSDAVVKSAELYCKDKGFPTLSVEQILEATKSERVAVCNQAMILLVDRIGQEAKPVLEDALKSQAVTTREQAAELLACLGDASGLETLRSDFEDQLKAFESGVRDLNDPNGWPRTPSPYRALRMASMLARFGDNRGFDLAVKSALEGKASTRRIAGIEVLFDINMCSEKAALRAERKDPEPILLMLAESEADAMVLAYFTNRTISHSGGELRLTLHRKILASPHMPEALRERILRVSPALRSESNPPLEKAHEKKK